MSPQDDTVVKILADGLAEVRGSVDRTRVEVLDAIRDVKRDQARENEEALARDESLAARVTALERFRWQLAGGLFVLSIVLGVVQAVVLKIIL